MSSTKAYLTTYYNITSFLRPQINDIYIYMSKLQNILA